MGQVALTVEVANAFDVERAQTGLIADTAVRRAVIDDVLADTGATNLCLPLDIIENLGLLKLDDVIVATALGESTVGLYHALLTIQGRTRTVNCVALPVGGRPLLGAIPMEDLGIEMDLRTRTIRLLSDQGPESYITAM